MKQARYITLAAALLTVFACQRGIDEVMPVGQVEEGKITVTADVAMPAGAEESKTALSGNSVFWTTADAFSMLSQDGNTKFTIVSGVGTAKGTFSGDPVAGECYALYPYDASSRLEGDTIRFSVPQTQVYRNGTFMPSTLPMIAAYDAAAGTASFKNLFGLISIPIKASPSTKVFKLAIHDHSGTPLWGDAALAVNGKQGTDMQKMQMYGGSNTIYIDLGTSGVSFNSTAKTVVAVVPANSFKHGFSVIFYDKDDNMIGFLGSQSPANVIERNVITQMPTAVMKADFESANVLNRGYYKDIFMDAGIYLTHRTTLHAATYLGLSLEYINVAPNEELTKRDTLYQKKIVVGDENDLNGVLVYPDGEPRFRTYYCNGGQSTKHGRSMGADGRTAIRNYFNAGGSYVGTCAGMFFSCEGYDSNENYTYYLHIFPGHSYHTGMSKTTTDMIFEDNCPLFNYDCLKEFTFPGNLIQSIYHNGGGYMSVASKYFKEGTEILMRFANCPSGGESNNGRVSTWAFKDSEIHGRVVVSGSHPEKETSGDKRGLFGAMLLYAMDGVGIQQSKGELVNGEWRDMDKGTKAKDPAYTAIGDMQYHHFTVEIPEGAHDITIDLEGIEGYNYILCMNKDNFAWKADAQFVQAGNGHEKTFSFDSLPAGTYYVSVQLNESVTATPYKEDGIDYYMEYGGPVEILNGIPYSIRASWSN